MVRESNQDVGLDLGAGGAPKGAECLLVVADGLGGHAAGDVASSMAVDELVRSVFALLTEDCDVGLLLKHAVTQANTAVYQAGRLPGNIGMGTTLTAALVVGPRLYVANVGDSRCYLSKNGFLRQITEDHSFVASKMRSGELTIEEARIHPYRNIVTRAIGLEPTVGIDIFSESLSVEDRILLCSDGLYGLVAEGDIEKILQVNKPSLACLELVREANANGGHDNITVAVAIVKKEDNSPGNSSEGV